MSDEDEHLSPDIKELGRLVENMTAGEKLMAAAQLGHGSMVKELLMQGTRVSIDQVRYKGWFLNNISIVPHFSAVIRRSSSNKL